MRDNGIGSVILEFVGAFIKWVVYAFVNSIQGKEMKSFKEILKGSKNSSKPDGIFYGASNVLLGAIALILLILFVNETWF
jgi:hypothetical protein